MRTSMTEGVSGTGIRLLPQGAPLTVIEETPFSVSLPFTTLMLYVEPRNLRTQLNEPISCGCKPAVLAFAMSRRVFAGDRLAICVRLSAVYLAYVFKEHRVCLAVYLERAVSMPEHGLGNGYPWIAVAEYAGVFLVTRRV